MGLPRIQDELVADPGFYKRLAADMDGYHLLAKLLQAMTGICMPESDKNVNLMADRLSKIMPEFSLRTYLDLYKQIESGNPLLKQAFIEALTTNKTEFFREPDHFELLPRLVADIIAMKRKARKSSSIDLRIWCAAASKGHEPYSILFSLLEQRLDAQKVNLRFLATDIDTQVLSVGARGVYTDAQCNGIPDHIRAKYMSPMTAPNGAKVYKVRDEFRQMITFAPFNLMDMPYVFKNPFDVVFCRNVLMYFDAKTARKVKEGMSGIIAPQGYLLIGHAESGADRPSGLDLIGDAVYKKCMKESF